MPYSPDSTSLFLSNLQVTVIALTGHKKAVVRDSLSVFFVDRIRKVKGERSEVLIKRGTGVFHSHSPLVYDALSGPITLSLQVHDFGEHLVRGRDDL